MFAELDTMVSMHDVLAAYLLGAILLKVMPFDVAFDEPRRLMREAVVVEWREIVLRLGWGAWQ